MAEEQNEYGLPINKGEKRRTARLLPRYYRTEPNKKFIQATLDQLTQSGTVKKLNPKMIGVTRLGGYKWDGPNNKYPDQVIVLEGPEVTMYLLKMDVEEKSKIVVF
jgi:hypothetical protein